jgi:RHH-type proline utilization regulon transcriptional repressor/proline dehydrogenase/delta 1-pyrroline-5-carboxylate dehydrogenase
VTTAVELPSEVRSAIEALGVTVRFEDDAAWLTRAATLESGRVRLIGGSASELYSAVGGRPDIAIYGQPVTESGRVELLPFLREQAVSITAHRFGTPNQLSDDVI